MAAQCDGFWSDSSDLTHHGTLRWYMTTVHSSHNNSNNNNKDQSNLVKGGIADQCCHLVNGKSFFLVSWMQLHVLTWF